MSNAPSLWSLETKYLRRGISAIARVVIDGRPIRDFLAPSVSARAAHQMMLQTFEAWPSGSAADFLITPGGYLGAETPRDISRKRGWDSVTSDFPKLTDAAMAVARQVVSSEVLRAAAGRCRYLTLGIDLALGIDLESNAGHAELIGIFSLEDGSVVGWTGKSYPTSGQEKELIQIVDLQTHFLKAGEHRVLVLGCHDLNVFSPRGHAKLKPYGPRRERSDAIWKMVTEFRPTAVLHHPHFTDTPKSWQAAWKGLEGVTGVPDWASSICFYNNDKTLRSSLPKVLAGTRPAARPTLDFIFQINRNLPIHRETMKKFRTAAV
jgi:hypothetical protein